MPVKAKRAVEKRSEPVDVDPRFAAIVAAFAKHKDVTSGMMMSSYGLKVNGKIFAMFGRDRFVIKLPKQHVDQLVDQKRGERFDPGHGRIMKEWLSMESHAETWLALAEDAYAFVKAESLKIR